MNGFWNMVIALGTMVCGAVVKEGVKKMLKNKNK